MAWGGSLGPLVWLFAASVAAGAFGLRGIRRRGGLARSAFPSRPEPPPRPRRLDVAQAALGIAGAAALAWAWTVSLPHVWWLWCALLGAAACALWRETAAAAAPAGGRGAELALWSTAGLCALYALLAHRPDADDAFYIDLAVAAVDRPDLPLLAVDTLHGREDLSIHYPIYRLHGLELAVAAGAWLSGLPAWAVAHRWVAALAAAALPLAHAVLLRRLVPRHWLVATLALVFVLASVGETHRWYGNFALLRSWQGKSIALFVFVPLVQAFAIRFALQPTGRHWALLAAAQIGALGCSASAVWLAPLAAGLALACALPRGWEGLRRAGIGALASAYVLAAGALQKGAMVERTPTLQRIHATGERLGDALTQTLGDGALQLLGVVAIGVGWACCRGLAQRFAVVVPLGAVVVLLNPWADAWIRAHLTGPSTWRAMWAVPVPLLLALGIVAPLVWLPQRRSAAHGASALLALAFALLVPSHAGWSDANGVSLRRPGPKLEPEIARWARKVNERAPRLRVLAPPEVSAGIPLFHDHAYPLMVRNYLRPHRERVGATAYRDRYVMTRYAGGELVHDRAAAIFARGLDLYDVALVCLRTSEHLGAQRRILRRVGFVRGVQGVHYEIWERGPARGARAGPAIDSP